MDLAWDAVPGVAGYNVYRGTVSGGPYVKIAEMVALTSYTDCGLSAGTYYYVVTSVDSNGVESAYSNEAVAQIP